MPRAKCRYCNKLLKKPTTTNMCEECLSFWGEHHKDINMSTLRDFIIRVIENKEDYNVQS